MSILNDGARGPRPGWFDERRVIPQAAKRFLEMAMVGWHGPSGYKLLGF